MDYCNLSDFEINKMVAELQPYTSVVGDGKYPSISDNAVYVERRTFKYGNIEALGVDYCINPSDAWPIIIEIWGTLMSVVSYDFGVELGESKATLWDARAHMHGDDKLRAAMIVYLMMKVGEA